MAISEADYFITCDTQSILFYLLYYYYFIMRRRATYSNKVKKRLCALEKEWKAEAKRLEKE